MHEFVFFDCFIVSTMCCELGFKFLKVRVIRHTKTTATRTIFQTYRELDTSQKDNIILGPFYIYFNDIAIA